PRRCRSTTLFFFSSRRRHTRWPRDWSSDVCSSDLAIDLEQVLAKAAARGIAVEVNADPHRLDLDWRMVRRARELGVTCSIGADAHSTSGMANVAVGLGIARKGWLEPDQVLNTRDAE